MSDVLDAQTLIPAARNPVIVIVTPSLAKGVNLKVRWMMTLESESRNSFSAGKKRKNVSLRWIGSRS